MDDNRSNQIAAASDLGGKRRYTLEEALAEQEKTYAMLKQEMEAHRKWEALFWADPIVDDDATRTLERVKALLGVGLPALDLQALWEAMAEIEAWEARREAGRDGE